MTDHHEDGQMSFKSRWIYTDCGVLAYADRRAAKRHQCEVHSTQVPTH